MVKVLQSALQELSKPPAVFQLEWFRQYRFNETCSFHRLSLREYCPEMTI